MRRLLALLLLSGCCLAQQVFSPSSSAPVGTTNVLPTVVSVGAIGSSGAGSTLTLAPPASIVNGNCLLAFVTADSINPTWTGPAGFNTQLSFSPISSSANHIINMAVFSKIAASESGNYVFTISSPSGGELILLGFVAQFAGTTCALDGTPATATGNASTLTATGFSTTNTNDLVLILARQHETGAGVANIQKPLNSIKSVQANNTLLYSIANAYGNTQTAVIRFAQSGGAPATTDDSVMAMFALAPSTTSSTLPYVTNTNAASLDSLHTTNGVAVDGTITTLGNLALPNGGSCTATSPSLTFNSSGNVPSVQICANSSANLFIDAGRVLNQVTIGSGLHGGATLLLGNGSVDFISQDASQDEAITTTDLNNNLYWGHFGAADTQSNDDYYNARTGHFHHFTVGTGVYGGPGDVMAIGSAGFVGGVPVVQIATPPAPTVTPTCPACSNNATWGYKVCAVDINGGLTPCSAETQIVNTQNGTLDGTHFNTLTWNGSPGANSYKVFRSTAATSPATTGIIGTVTTGNASNVAKPFSFVDNNVAGDSSAATALNTTGKVSPVGYATATNCSSSASPAVCASAAAGSFVIAAAGTSVTVNTTAVTANSQIFVQEDESLGTKLSVTCNTGILANPPAITARTAGTSFAVGITAGLAVNPVCFSYFIVN